MSKFGIYRFKETTEGIQSNKKNNKYKKYISINCYRFLSY